MPPWPHLPHTPAHSPQLAGVGSEKSKNLRARSGGLDSKVCHFAGGPWYKLFHFMCQVGDKLLDSEIGTVWFLFGLKVGIPWLPPF
jgi:hypothetical protein